MAKQFDEFFLKALKIESKFHTWCLRESAEGVDRRPGDHAARRRGVAGPAGAAQPAHAPSAAAADGALRLDHGAQPEAQRRGEAPGRRGAAPAAHRAGGRGTHGSRPGAWSGALSHGVHLSAAAVGLFKSRPSDSGTKFNTLHYEIS